MCRFSGGEKFKLCGSVSYGNTRCGTNGAPGVYVQMAKFVNWIRNNTHKMCSEGRKCVPVSQCPEIRKQIDVISLEDHLVDPVIKDIFRGKVNEQRCDVKGIGRQSKYCCESPAITSLAKTNCLLSRWSSWGACSKTCGTGSKQRTRRIIQEPTNGGIQCSGQPIISKLSCNTTPCVTSGKSLLETCIRVPRLPPTIFFDFLDVGC